MLFPNHWLPFNDLVDLSKEESPGDRMEIDEEPTPGHIGEAEASSKSAQSLIGGELLNEIVSQHLNVYSALSASSANIWDIKGCYHEQYSLGTSLLAAAGGIAPRSLDDQTMSGRDCTLLTTVVMKCAFNSFCLLPKVTCFKFAARLNISWNLRCPKPFLQNTQ